jgi:hypothetical protein
VAAVCWRCIEDEYLKKIIRDEDPIITMERQRLRVKTSQALR